MPYADPAKQRAYCRRWVAERRAQWLTENGPCVCCGSANDLEVDHKDPKQKISHRVFSWSRERMAAELSKCQVLCHDCHAEKTFGPLPPHGTRARYLSHRDPCRCTACAAASHAYYHNYYVNVRCQRATTPQPAVLETTGQPL